MFRRFRVTVDYAAHVLTLTDPPKFTPPAKAHVVAFDLADKIPVISGTLDGLPVRLDVDTGSRSSLTLCSPFVKDHDLDKRYAAAPETVTGWGVGGAAKSRPARLGTLAIGDLVIKDIAGDLFVGNKGAFASPDFSANLGGGVLKRFTVSFDYDAHKMYLVPNADFATRPLRSQRHVAARRRRRAEGRRDRAARRRGEGRAQGRRPHPRHWWAIGESAPDRRVACAASRAGRGHARRAPGHRRNHRAEGRSRPRGRDPGARGRGGALGRREQRPQRAWSQ
jgi:hypothetical protein